MPCYRFYGDHMSPHVVELKRPISDFEMAEMAAWCTDEDSGTTGWFDYSRVYPPYPGLNDGKVIFRFSDIPTAALFKLRFG